MIRLSKTFEANFERRRYIYSGIIMLSFFPPSTSACKLKLTECCKTSRMFVEDTLDADQINPGIWFGHIVENVGWECNRRSFEHGLDRASLEGSILSPHDCVLRVFEIRH